MRTLAIFCDFAERDSLRPTIRWRNFPGPRDDLAAKEISLDETLIFFTHHETKTMDGGERGSPFQTPFS